MLLLNGGDHMQLKEVIEQTELTKKAIRYYESCNLIQVNRKENGYRNYSEENINRLLEIKKLRNLNFSIQEIQRFFRSEEDKVAVLTKKISEIDNQLMISHLQKEALTELIKGENLDEIQINESNHSKRKAYLYIPNLNSYFGFLNLIIFISAFIYFLAIKPLAPVNIWIFLISQFLSLFLNLGLYYKRVKLRRLGISINEKKTWEVIQQMIANSLQYVASAMFVSDLIYYAFVNSTHYDLFNLIGSVTMICLFFGVSVTLAIVSFIDIDLEISHVI